MHPHLQHAAQQVFGLPTLCQPSDTSWCLSLLNPSESCLRQIVFVRRASCLPASAQWQPHRQVSAPGLSRLQL